MCWVCWCRSGTVSTKDFIRPLTIILVFIFFVRKTRENTTRPGSRMEIIRFPSCRIPARWISGPVFVCPSPGRCPFILTFYQYNRTTKRNGGLLRYFLLYGIANRFLFNVKFFSNFFLCHPGGIFAPKNNPGSPVVDPV